jgi:hypothetical protein
MQEFRDLEPFYGWLNLYNHEMDERSPFHQVKHNLFYYDRFIHNIPCHPLWDDIGSESLLVKILYADYKEGYAIIELFGEWNDLFLNDYKLLAENCLTFLIDAGINRFVLIGENVFHIYLETDDYYEALQEELADGWICLMRMRDEVYQELESYGILEYFYTSPLVDELPWRKLKPRQLFQVIQDRMAKLLE